MFRHLLYHLDIHFHFAFPSRAADALASFISVWATIIRNILQIFMRRVTRCLPLVVGSSGSPQSVKKSPPMAMAFAFPFA